jgi:hypothetical protein
MSTPIDNSWKNNFSNSQALYQYFSKPRLINAISNALASAGNISVTLPQIDTAIESILQPLDFGNINHVPHVPVDGSTDNNYPNASVNTPLRAFRISSNSSIRKPRVVITAGMHARELAPPQAVARFFSAMIVSYLTDKLLDDPNSTGLPVIHRGFNYRSGKNHVFDSNNKDITKSTRMNKDDKYADDELDTDIYINQCEFNEINELIEKLEIIVFPTCNPAGLDFVLTQNQESVEDAINRANWRKNRAAISRDQVPLVNGGGIASIRLTNDEAPADKNMFAIGVDINRNADICWYYPLYYSAEYLSKELHSCSRNPYNYSNYIGSNPNSELETRAILSALMSSISQMTTTFPASLLPTAVAGPVVPVENSTGFPVGLGITPDPATSSDDILYQVAGRPTFIYDDYLFYLDIHSYSRVIVVPWGMETLTEVGMPLNGQRPTYLNTFFNQKRDGLWRVKLSDRGKMNVSTLSTSLLYISKSTLTNRNDTYQEYFPSHLTFRDNTSAGSLTPIDHNLLTEQVNTFAFSMKQAITRAITSAVSPSNRHRLERRSAYKIGQGPLMYTVTGSPNDYAFSLNIRDIVGFGDNLPLPNISDPAVPINPIRKGPVIALAIEVGHEDEGGFFPLDKHPATTPPFKPYVDFDVELKGAYSKIERETFAAIHSYLKQSLMYFNKQFIP